MLRRQIPALLVAVTFVLAGGAWAVSSPAGSSPDDDYHLASIWCGWGVSEGTCEAPADPGGERLVRGDVVHAPCIAFHSETSGSCSYGLDASPVPARTNADGAYPPLFYATMRVFVGDGVATSVVRMRLCNLLLGAVMLGAAVALSAPLQRRSVALAWLGTAVPLAMFVVPSTNPSSWVVAGIGTYWAFLLSFLTRPPGGGRWLVGGLAVVSAVMAAGARSDGAAFLGISTVAVVLFACRWRDLVQRRMLLPLAVVLGGAAVFLTAGQSSAVGGIGGAEGLPQRSGLGLLARNANDLPGLLAGVFGQGWGLGWLDTFVPPGASILSAGTALALLVLSATSYTRPKALAVGLVAAVLVAMPLYVLQAGGNVVGENLQPRYLLPLVTVLLGFALLVHDDRGPSWPLGRARTGVLVVAVAAANAMSLQSELRRYVTGNDVVDLRLDQGVEWWWGSPVDPMVLWVAGSFAGLALFAALGWAALVGGESAPVAQEHG
jgi:hypothetical protein